MAGSFFLALAFLLAVLSLRRPERSRDWGLHCRGGVLGEDDETSLNSQCLLTGHGEVELWLSHDDRHTTRGGGCQSQRENPPPQDCCLFPKGAWLDLQPFFHPPGSRHLVGKCRAVRKGTPKMGQGDDGSSPLLSTLVVPPSPPVSHHVFFLGGCPRAPPTVGFNAGCPLLTCFTDGGGSSVHPVAFPHCC